MKIIINGKVYNNNCDKQVVKLKLMMEKLGFYDIPVRELEDMWVNICVAHDYEELPIPDSEEKLLDLLESIKL